MRIPRSTSIRLAIGLLIVLASAACAGSAAQLAPVGGNGGAPAPSSAPRGNDNSGNGGNGNGGNGGGGGGNVAAAVDEAKIIRTGTMDLLVGNVDEAVGKARQAVAAVGGYIGASQQLNEEDQSVATVTYRIPTNQWEEALASLRGLGTKVLGENTEAVEVTGQLVDLEARIANLRASERALQTIAEGATRIADVLEVQQRLTDVRGQIEQLSAQLARLEDQVTYGTMTVTFGLQVLAVTQAAENWDAAREVDQATASLVDVLQALATAGIWFGIVWLPLIVTIGVIAIFTLAVLRRLGVIRRPIRAASDL